MPAAVAGQHGVGPEQHGGGIKNAFIGLLIFGILSNGLNLIEGLSIHFKDALEGIILVGALLLNVLALRLERVQVSAE